MFLGLIVSFSPVGWLANHGSLMWKIWHSDCSSLQSLYFWRLQRRYIITYRNPLISPKKCRQRDKVALRCSTQTGRQRLVSLWKLYSLLPPAVSTIQKPNVSLNWEKMDWEIRTYWSRVLVRSEITTYHWSCSVEHMLPLPNHKHITQHVIPFIWILLNNTTLHMQLSIRDDRTC